MIYIFMNDMSNIRNFKLIWWFWVSEKEIEQKKLDVLEIINNFYNVWIEEFFVWYNPEYWHWKYAFSISPNWRFWENEQISTFETFKKSVEYIHSLLRKDWKRCEVVLTVNWWFYNDVTTPLIKEIIKEAIEIWVDWFIVWSYEILEYLSEIKYTWKVHISTILNVYNTEAIKFYIQYCKEHNLNLNRIVLPREMTIKEIEKIVDTFPDMNFEVFWQWDYCRYANWNCFAEHKYFSRDLCTFVLKHWLETKKRVRYDFKNIIMNTDLNDVEKQDLLDPRLENIWNKKQFLLKQCEYMYATNVIVWKENKSFDFILNYVQDLFFKDTYTEDEVEFIHMLILDTKKEFLVNLCKYIYDWLLPENNFYNITVKRMIQLCKMILWIYTKLENKDNQMLELAIQKIRENLEILEKYKKLWEEYYENEIKNRWQFWLETYYKFMLYNRTSAPFFHIFNNHKNIEVVKIPLRWRDPVIFKMWLDLIDDAINNPSKYENYLWTITWKYFHYDLNIKY